MSPLLLVAAVLLAVANTWNERRRLAARTRADRVLALVTDILVTFGLVTLVVACFLV